MIYFPALLCDMTLNQKTLKGQSCSVCFSLSSGMEFHLNLLQILIISNICIGFAAAGSEQDLNPSLVIGSSCVLEAIDPNDGNFDQEVSDACGKCFEGAGSDISGFR